VFSLFGDFSIFYSGIEEQFPKIEIDKSVNVELIELFIVKVW